MELDKPVFARPVDAVRPGTITAAAVIWIIVGSLVLLELAGVLLLGAIGLASGDSLGFALGMGVCVGPILGLIGGSFVYVGVQTLRGKARDTLGNAVGSICVGALYLSGPLLALLGGPADESPSIKSSFAAGAACLAIVIAAGLLLSGILALVGRRAYKAWRQIRQVGQTAAGS